MSEVWINYLDANIPPANDADRVMIEQRIGNRLPGDYWEIVAAHQGHIRDHDSFVLSNREEIMMGVLLTVTQGDLLSDVAKSYGLLDTYGVLQGIRPPEIVPFSDDTGGNYLAFDFRNSGEPSIVFVNHEVEGEDGLIWAAPNFAALIAGLFKSKDD